MMRTILTLIAGALIALGARALYREFGGDQ